MKPKTYVFASASEANRTVKNTSRPLRSGVVSPSELSASETITKIMIPKIMAVSNCGRDIDTVKTPVMQREGQRAPAQREGRRLLGGQDPAELFGVMGLRRLLEAHARRHEPPHAWRVGR
jgi:hypothetical protein